VQHSIHKKKMIITGASGLLGSNLSYYFKDQFDVLGLYHKHALQIDGIQTQRIDLTSQEEVKEILYQYKPAVVIHCAALTNIDACERDKDLAYQLNVSVVRNIVESIEGSAAKLVHISTDNIYDGQTGYYSETDACSPINIYGETKLLGEEESLKHDNTLVVRTNIFGWNVQEKMSLAEWVISSLSQKKEIKGFTDAFFSSIYTLKFAALLERAIDMDLKGIFNIASSTTLSKYEFAKELAGLFSLDEKLIEPSSLYDFPFMARRGRDLRLMVDKLERQFCEKLPTMEESLETFHQDYAKGLPAAIKTGCVLN